MDVSGTGRSVITRNRTRLLFLLAFTAILLGLATSSLAATGTLPQVMKVDGEATLKKPGEAAWVKLVAGMTIPEASRLQTRMGSRVIIKLENGSQLSLTENSIFEVVKSTQGRYEFRLWVGNVRSRVSALGANERYTVSTAVAVAGVRGTDFLLGAQDGGRTDLSVYSGAVSFRAVATGQQVMVNANQSASISPDGTVSEVSNSVAEDESFAESGDTGATGSTAGPGDGTVTLAVSAPLDGTRLSARSVTVMGTVTPAMPVQVNGTPATVDGSGRFTAALTLNEGVNVITVIGGTATQTITVTVDSLAPAITLGAYPELTNVPAVTLTVTTKAGATVAAGGVSVTAASGVAALPLSLVEGENIITVTATDAGGLSATKSIRITLDTTKPRMTIIAMTATSDGVRVNGLTEPGVTVSANGYPLDVRTDGSFDQVLYGLTAQELTFEARDKAGNVTREVHNVSGAVDNAPPSLVSLTFTPSVLDGGGNVAVAMVVSDASPVSPTVSLSLSGANGGSLATSLSTSSLTYTGSLYVPPTQTGGVYSCNPVTLADILGNTTTVTPTTTLYISNAPPSPPSSVSAVDATTGGRATVTWSSVSAPDLQDYTLYQGHSASGPWSPIYTGTSNSQTLTNLIDGTTYYYCVTARDISGNVSAYSTVASVTPSDQVAPPTPGSLSASALSSSSIALSWSASSGATSYKVYRSLSASGGAPWQMVAPVFGNSYTVNGLASGTTYYFSVTALDNNSAPPSGMPNESVVGGNSASATTP